MQAKARHQRLLLENKRRMLEAQINSLQAEFDEQKEEIERLIEEETKAESRSEANRTEVAKMRQANGPKNQGGGNG